MNGAELVSNVRNLCHAETARGQARPLVVLALELCARHETLLGQALRMEEVIHRLTKEGK